MVTICRRPTYVVPQTHNRTMPSLLAQVPVALTATFACLPQHHRLCARRLARNAAQDDWHATHQDAGCPATGPNRLSQRCVGLQDHAQVAWPALPRTA